MEISILNEASLIDLNSADRALLAGLLSALGLAPEVQDPLLDAILDWRDEDDLHLLNGAEDPDYDAAGVPYGAKDGPFDSVEELRQVLGIEAEVYNAVAPVLTVNSGSRRISEQLAPPLVLAAIEGSTLEEVEARQAEDTFNQPRDTEARPLDRGGPLYRIRVRRQNKQGSARAMEALVLIQQTLDPPIRVLWRRFGLLRKLAPPFPEGAQALDE
jgi:general secretion pathway protein K